MQIIKENIDELIIKSKYICRNKYPDCNINKLFNYWIFFEENEKVIQDLTGVPIETILYSKYYWCSRFKEQFNKIYGKDAGIEQQQFKIIEEITRRITNINWELIQMLEENLN